MFPIKWSLYLLRILVFISWRKDEPEVFPPLCHLVSLLQHSIYWNIGFILIKIPIKLTWNILRIILPRMPGIYAAESTKVSYPVRCIDLQTVLCECLLLNIGIRILLNGPPMHNHHHRHSSNGNIPSMVWRMPLY